MKIICLILTDGYKLNVVKCYDVCMSLRINRIRILGIELELACTQGLCGEIFSESFHRQIVSDIFPRKSLHCKLDPVQYREYEYGLL